MNLPISLKKYMKGCKPLLYFFRLYSFQSLIYVEITLLTPLKRGIKQNKYMDKRLESLISETIDMLENLKKVQLDLLERKDLNSEQFISEYFKIMDPIVNRVSETVGRRKRILMELISEGILSEEDPPQEIENLEEEIKVINSRVVEKFGGNEKFIELTVAHYEKIASKIEKEMEL